MSEIAPPKSFPAYEISFTDLECLINRYALDDTLASCQLNREFLLPVLPLETLNKEMLTTKGDFSIRSSLRRKAKSTFAK